MSFKAFTNSVFNIARRRKALESYPWWSELNYAQKLSAGSLFNFGYDIEFIRREDDITLVVMSLDNVTVTVNQDGLIDTHPDIKRRRN
ncbi:hypothetical protein [Litorilituus lipolyticus]|uniref:Uncharacterized protein n=1 Tax=Litorilituus lipolyticus TaxID=2491017 RepID=A0A502KS27_9GAMM|nr:hypothetical protein [Litorilituus lipolyticus]TPH12831.1 hypothetical protein EPA86_15530 [Litorilituus lipolyticus]